MENKINLFDLGVSIESNEIAFDRDNMEDIKCVDKIPYEKILTGIDTVVAFSVGDRNYISYPLVKMLKELVLVSMYTNLDCGDPYGSNFTAEDLYLTYDILTEIGIIDFIKRVVDKAQIEFFEKNTDDTLDSIMKYQQSALGIVNTVGQSAKEDAKNMEEVMNEFDSEKMQEVLTLLNTAKDQIK